MHSSDQSERRLRALIDVDASCRQPVVCGAREWVPHAHLLIVGAVEPTRDPSADPRPHRVVSQVRGPGACACEGPGLDRLLVVTTRVVRAATTDRCEAEVSTRGGLVLD